MSRPSISRSYRNRIISSIIFMIILGVIFFPSMDSFGLVYLLGMVIYLAFMIFRYRKIKKAEESMMAGQMQGGVRLNPANNQYPNGLGQPPFYKQRNSPKYKDDQELETVYDTIEGKNKPYADTKIDIDAINRREAVPSKGISSDLIPMFCQNCGSKLPTQKAKFCENCGAKI